MKIGFAAVALAAALIATQSVPLASDAQAHHPLAQHVVPGSRVPAAPRTPAAAASGLYKKMFGVVQRIDGPHSFLLYRRNGRLQNVDYTTALQSGNYSYPMFVGKFLLVAGTFDAKRLFHAVYMNRMTYIDVKTTDPDDPGT